MCTKFSRYRVVTSCVAIFLVMGVVLLVGIGRRGHENSDSPPPTFTEEERVHLLYDVIDTGLGDTQYHSPIIISGRVYATVKSSTKHSAAVVWSERLGKEQLSSAPNSILCGAAAESSGGVSLLVFETAEDWSDKRYVLIRPDGTRVALNLPRGCWFNKTVALTTEFVVARDQHSAQSTIVVFDVESGEQLKFESELHDVELDGGSDGWFLFRKKGEAFIGRIQRGTGDNQLARWIFHHPKLPTGGSVRFHGTSGAFAVGEAGIPSSRSNEVPFMVNLERDVSPLLSTAWLPLSGSEAEAGACLAVNLAGVGVGYVSDVPYEPRYGRGNFIAATWLPDKDGSYKYPTVLHHVADTGGRWLSYASSIDEGGRIVACGAPWNERGSVHSELLVLVPRVRQPLVEDKSQQ